MSVAARPVEGLQPAVILCGCAPLSADAGSFQGLMAEMGRRDAQRIVRDLTVMGEQPVVLLTEVLAALEPGRHAGGQYAHPSRAVQCPWVAWCRVVCQVCCLCSLACFSVRQLRGHHALLEHTCCMEPCKMHRPPHVQPLCASHCGLTGTRWMALLNAIAQCVCPAGNKHSVTKQVWPAVAPPKQPQASGEFALTPVSRCSQDNGWAVSFPSAGPLPLCMAWCYLCCRVLPDSSGAVWHALQDVAYQILLPVCTAGHKEALKGQQTGPTGRPAAGARVITAPRRSRQSQSNMQIPIQAGDPETACWDAHDAAVASHCYPSGAQQDPCLHTELRAEVMGPPPCMSCPPS